MYAAREADNQAAWLLEAAENGFEATPGGVDSLDLRPKAKAIASELRQTYPAIVFTSGKRSEVEGQARAMAGNVVSNRAWIAETYSDKSLSGQLQDWVDKNPTATTKNAIAVGLAGVMATWSEEQKGKLSAHFTGEAFDIQPQTEDADAIKSRAASLATAAGGKFLEKEGGLVRWHLQVRE